VSFGHNVKRIDLTSALIRNPGDPHMASQRTARRERELDQAWELMHFALRAVIARPDQMLERRGLSRVHHRILFFVARQPDLTVNELLQVLGVSKQALNLPLRQLYTQNLVTYTPAPQDRRQRRLVLTEAGRELERRLTEPQRRMFDAALTGAGVRAEVAWRRVMRHMAIEEMERSGRA
jgi:DNA-binding MarR family transcriptional regulator